MSTPEGLFRGDSHDNEEDVMLGILCDKKEIDHRPAMITVIIVLVGP